MMLCNWKLDVVQLDALQLEHFMIANMRVVQLLHMSVCVLVSSYAVSNSPRVLSRRRMLLSLYTIRPCTRHCLADMLQSSMHMRDLAHDACMLKLAVSADLTAPKSRSSVQCCCVGTSSEQAYSSQGLQSCSKLMR